MFGFLIAFNCIIVLCFSIDIFLSGTFVFGSGDEESLIVIDEVMESCVDHMDQSLICTQNSLSTHVHSSTGHRVRVKRRWSIVQINTV